MAKAQLKKEMKRLSKAIDDAFARGVLDSERQLVTITRRNMEESWIEGYELLRKKHAKNPKVKLPVIHRTYFNIGVRNAFPGIIEKIGKKRNHDIIKVKHDRFVFSQNKGYSKDAFDIIKKPLIEFIQGRLKDYKLTDAKAEASILNGTDTPTGKQILAAAGKSDIGVLKSGSVREHSGKTTVGAVRLVAAMKWMTTDKYFRQFTGMKTSKSFSEKYGGFQAIFDTKGTKKGSLRLKIREDVSVFLGPASKNYPGSQVNDWASSSGKKRLRDRLEAEMVRHLRAQKLEDFKGSPSIADNAEDAVAYELMSSFKKSKRVRTSGPRTKNTSRKRNRVIHENTSKRDPDVGKTVSKVAIAAAPKAQKSTRLSSPINLMAILNSKINRTVQKNMGAPRLENQTGTFANSVRITDVSATPQGFPSVGYTYQRQPYGVFESSSGSRFASVQRDPRPLIDASIREIAASLVETRIYTRRQ